MISRPLGRAAFVVLGCAKNQVEAEAMSTRLAQAGWEMTADIPNASVLVVHTCGFLEAARQEALNTIANLRRAAPRSFLVMTGCFAQYINKSRWPKGVDALLGTGEFHKLPEVMAAAARGPLPRTRDDAWPHRRPSLWNGAKRAGAATAVSGPSGFHDAAAPRPLRPGQISTYLRISEGCNHRCTFCIIPQLRGNLKSRAPADIYAEARGLVDRGVKELVLISQDTTDYGRDTGLPLTDLLRPMLAWKDLNWLRLLYAYPSEVNDELIALLAGEEKLCGYLDMPLQHISDRVLKNMARAWGQKETMALLEKLRRRVPHLTLRTTFIVGFPGETEADFKELLSLTKSGLLDHVGVFPYSLEGRSPSSRSEDQVPPEAAQERWDRLVAAHSVVLDKKNAARVGQTIDVLAEVAPDGAWDVRGRHQAPEVDGGVILEKPPAAPGFYRARVTGHDGVHLNAAWAPARHRPMHRSSVYRPAPLSQGSRDGGVAERRHPRQ